MADGYPLTEEIRDFLPKLRIVLITARSPGKQLDLGAT